jgi:hypothetical protein
MRTAILLASLLLVRPAAAYDIKNLSVLDIKLIGEALDNMPHGRVADLYNRIQAQLTAEDAANAAAARAAIEKEVRAKLDAKPKDKPQ